MLLKIDGIEVMPQPGQSLLDIIKQMGMEGKNISERPIAAKIAGEVFSLNYVPIRDKDSSQERQSIRRAMAASGGTIQLLRLTDPAGRDVYDRTGIWQIGAGIGTQISYVEGLRQGVLHWWADLPVGTGDWQFVSKMGF